LPPRLRTVLPLWGCYLTCYDHAMVGLSRKIEFCIARKQSRLPG
jgi:uncharacterized protein YlaN (UPF0358 family)